MYININNLEGMKKEHNRDNEHVDVPRREFMIDNIITKLMCK